MNIRLTITQRDQPGTTQAPRMEDFDLDNILLGRDASCNVVLTSVTVSRFHARIIQDGGICYIEDVGSSFGTQVNNEPLPPGEKRRLYNGNVIAIAQFDLRFDAVVPMPKEPGTGVWTPRAAKSPFAILPDENPYLRIMNGPNEGTRIELEEGHEYIVGRTQEAHILLNTDLISRKHAKLRRDLGGTHVEDLGSRNGIRLNKKPITSATLSDGDELEMGGIKMLYIDLENINLPFDNPEPKTSAPPEPPPPPPPVAPAAPPPKPPPPEPEVREQKSPPKKAPPKAPPEEVPPEAMPSEEAPPEEDMDNLGMPETSGKKTPPPLLKGKQAIVLAGIGGGAALLAFIILILILIGF